MKREGKFSMNREQRIMKNTQNRWLSFVFVIFIVIGMVFLPACSGNQADVPSESESETFQIGASYRVVRSDSDDSYLEAARLVYETLKKITGSEDIELTTDFVRRGQEIVPEEYEILVGPTNRKESEEAMENLCVNDYIYDVKSPNVIVITGGSPESAVKAAEKFLLDAFDYSKTETGVNRPISAGMTYRFTDTYPVKTLTVNMHDSSEYSIVVDLENTTFLTAARKLNNAISGLTGKNLPVVTAKNLKTPHRIVLTTDSSQRKDQSRFSYEVKYQNDDFVIAASEDTLQSAVEYVSKRYFSKYDGDTLAIEPDVQTYEGYEFEDQANGLVFRKIRKSGTVTEGVSWSIREYSDNEGKPVVAYVMELDPNVATLMIGTPDNDGGKLTGKLQHVEDICKAAEADGITVFGSVNGDLYYYETDNSVLGVCVKNGVVIHEDKEGWPFFAIMKDGTPFIGYGKDLNGDFSDVWQAVGGRGYILKDHSIHDIMWDVDFAYIRHPRTSLGFRDDGTILVVEVDGRQPEISNGASFADLALIYKELGAKDAINIDGGGSSIFYIHDQQTGEYRYLNSPSGGSPRRVANCTMIVQKDEKTTYQGSDS